MELLAEGILFYGGIIMAIASLMIGTICFCILKIRKMHLDAQLDTEYGKISSKRK